MNVKKKLKVKTGKRKTAIVRVVLKPGEGKVTINGKELKEYLGCRLLLEKKIISPFEITSTQNQYDVNVRAVGGGIVSQADAIRHAIAKYLCDISIKHRPALKAAGLLSRDSRIKERKKYGQPKARKKFQFSKR